MTYIELKKKFEEYHNCIISEDVVSHLVNECDKRILDRNFPDKAIDVLDASCVKVKDGRLSKEIIDECIDKITNRREYKREKIKRRINNYFKDTASCNKFIKEFESDNNKVKKMNISSSNKDKMIEMVDKIFGENIIDIDLSSFDSTLGESKLLGATAGYVGYDDNVGVLKDIIKYPSSFIFISSFSDCNRKIKLLFDKIMKQGFIKDNHNKILNFRNSFFFIVDDCKEKNIGFLSKKNREKCTHSL